MPRSLAMWCAWNTVTGVEGVSEQDTMIQDSQGLIADRTREHLGPTDAWSRPPRATVMLARAGRQHVAERSLSFAEVMAKRFGDPVGCVAR